MTFEELPLSDDLLDALYDMHFEECTPIQEQCIPPILEGRDVVGIAQTGTGKTAAYLLPLLTRLTQEEHERSTPRCLIMAPTRELALQIDQALQGFGYYANFSGVAIYGGGDGIRFEQERRSLQNGADIVIATPGRLISHINLGTADLSDVTHLVLDEADRMLDMGFADDILKIVSFLPRKRQTVLFSATMPEKTADLAREIMTAPLEVRIKINAPAEGIRQYVYMVKERDKDQLLARLFSEEPPRRAILFASKKQKVKELVARLSQKFNHNKEKVGEQLVIAAMHSDLEQREREQVMLAFKAGHTQLLIATDIVSRGIDIDDIELVINYDPPRAPEDYVHRVGRTARAGKTGKAITLISERDMPLLRNIEQLVKKEIPRLQLPDGFQSPSFGKSGSSRHEGGKNTRGKGKHGKARTRGRNGRKRASAANGAEKPQSKQKPSRRKGRDKEENTFSKPS